MCTTRLIQCTDVKRLWFGVNRSNDIESIIKWKKIYNFFFFFYSLPCVFEHKRINMFLLLPLARAALQHNKRKHWRICGQLSGCVSQQQHHQVRSEDLLWEPRRRGRWTVTHAAFTECWRWIAERWISEFHVRELPPSFPVGIHLLSLIHLTGTSASGWVPRASRPHQSSNRHKYSNVRAQCTSSR